MSAAAVADQLRAKIESGQYSAEQALPSKNVIAGNLNTSTGTVQRAFDALTAEGLTVSRRGAGLFVAAPAQPTSWEALSAQAEAAGPIEETAPRWVREHLGDNASTRVESAADVLIMRWDHENEQPVADASKLKAHGRAAAPEERRLLDVRPGTPVLALVQWFYSREIVTRIDRITATGNRVIDFGTLAYQDHE